MALKVNLGNLGKAYGPNLGFLNDIGAQIGQLAGANEAAQAQPAYYPQDYSGGGGTGNYVQSYDVPQGPAYDPGSLYYQPAYTPPDKILEQSPEWLAYINALGLQKSQFAADIARQREIAGANAAFARAGVEPQYAQQRRGITSGAESRGMARSGELQRNLATSRGQEQRAYSGIYQNLQNTLSDLQSNLAQKNLELDAQREQQKAQMLGNGYKSNGLYDYLKSLPKAPGT